MASLWKFHLNVWAVLIMVIQVIFYGLSYIDGVTPYLAITVARVLPPHFWVWTLVTFNFHNTCLLHLLLDMVTVYLVDVVMFPSWKLLEVVKCSILSQFSSASLVVCTLFIGYACTFNTNLLYVTPIFGLSPLLGTVLVVARQLTPDNILVNLPLGKFRTKHIVFTVFICFLLFTILHITDFVHFLLFSNGTFVTWVYLRFYQRHSNGDIGDTTDAFKFSGFFPNHLEPPISIVSNAIYDRLVKIHICKPKTIFETEYVDPLVTIRIVNDDKISSGVSDQSSGLNSDPSAKSPVQGDVVKSS
ncbi:hypothetical protein Aperf_G00000059674 [Anoplocephala perfoliata]